MKEMEYKSESISDNNPPVLLCHATYKAYEYYVLSMHSHPCAYVVIHGNNELYGKSGEELDELISCHGGVTYAEPYLGNKQQFIGKNEGKWVIGWDYHHCDDYSGYFNNFTPISGDSEAYGHKYTTLEIINEIHDVIQQLIDLEE